MSRYGPHGDTDDRSVASDTFLSRVFGLHSIYNQLDNYQYDDHAASTANADNGSMAGPVSPTQPRADSPTPADSAIVHETPLALLNSELELDFSSDEQPSPLLRPHDERPLLAFARHAEPHVNWNTNVLRHTTDDADDADEPDDEFARSLYSKPEPLFRLPKLFLKKPDDALPLYSHRKPVEQAHVPYRSLSNRIVIPPKERALYLWANIVNMDEFLIDVYYYYRGKGFASIITSRVVDILILVFILWFSTFLKWGIDYDHFFNHWSSNSDVNLTLGDLIIPGWLLHRVPFPVKFLLFGFACYIALRLIQIYFDYRYKLAELRNFYRHLLGIADDLELMTISWSTIVERLMLLEDYNSLTTTKAMPPHLVNDLNSKIRFNAHDIANRIMRKENYMIALINKDVLDLSIPVPVFLNSIFSGRSVLTRTLEWNLKLCINNFVFDENGQINKNILKEASRNQLSQELSSRFKMASIINLILCPFIVIYFVLLYFFRYFNEYKSNPSSLLGLRQYSPWAEWKLREFNELPHFFIRRLHLSIGPANTYINQFPSGVLVMNLMTLVNFVSGAFLAVLVIMGLLFEDEEHKFWSFELSPNRSTVFYISIFGTLWAVTSNSLHSSTVTNTAENLNTQGSSFFYDPEASLRYVSQFTHYLPSSWNRKLHTVEVKNEFCELYSLKILIILNEILSLILTPFVLWFKVANNSSAIIDFFREYSIHVDGLGYVCYFAMFNFEEKDKNMMYELNKKRSKRRPSVKKRDKVTKSKAKQTDSESSDEDSDPELNDYYQDDKMIKSYMYFLESYGNKPNRAKARPARSNAAQEGPSSSLMMSKPKHNGSAEAFRASPLQSVYESSYNLLDKIDEGSERKEKGRKGVLGMINQFSKQEPGR